MPQFEPVPEQQPMNPVILEQAIDSVVRVGTVLIVATLVQERVAREKREKSLAENKAAAAATRSTATPTTTRAIAPNDDDDEDDDDKTVSVCLACKC
jgi:hypothetical protein